jgi:hypothetical protein
MVRNSLKISKNTTETSSMVVNKLRFLSGLLAHAFLSAGLAAQEVPQAMTFDGRAFGNSEATIPMLDIISTKIQILTPAQDCVLYEETQSLDTRATNGYFTIQIGSGISDPKRTGYDSNLEMSKVFGNRSAVVSGKRVTDGSACSYTPAGGDKRYVRVQMTPAADGVTRSISPNMALDSVPNAMVAETVQGLAPADFVQVNSGGSAVLSQANLENIFSSTNYPNLVNLLSVTPTSYVRTGTNGSATLPSVSGDPATGLTAGQIWYDSVANVIKYYDGTTKTLGTSVGLSSIGLTLPGIFTVTGSPLTANGSISATLANQNANLVFAGPASGGAAAPTFRAIASADLPTTGASGLYQNGGNSFGAAATLGTNDANTFTIKTNNIARMSIDTSGNVGIGTASPSKLLEVNGDTLITGTLSMASTTPYGPATWINGTTSQIRGSRDYIDLQKYVRVDKNLAVGGAGWAGIDTQIPTLYVNGKTGLGTAAPLSLLDVSGGVAVGTYAGTVAAPSNGLIVSGNVGIGTATPGYALTLVHSSGAEVGLSIQNTDPGATAVGAQFIDSAGTNRTQFGYNPSTGESYFWNSSSNPFKIGTNNLERMRVTASGNVGIGTTSPAQALDVNGNVNISSFLQVGGVNFTAVGGAGTAFWVGDLSGAGYSTNFYTNGTEKMRITSTGNVGIGTTSPNQALDVVGNINSSGTITAASTGNVVYTPSSASATDPIKGTNQVALLKTYNFNMSDGSGSYYIPMVRNAAGLVQRAYIGAVSNSGASEYKPTIVLGQQTGSNSYIESMRIDSSGNVGIGTTSPQTTLQVAGVISPATNNTYTLGNATYRFTEVYATNGTINTSDRREKKDIYNTDLGLDFINKLRPVSYRWNTGVDDDVHYGLIAQEAEQAITEIGKTEKTSIITHDEATDRYGVRYSELISPLIKAVQELYNRLLGVDREVASVKAENAQLKANDEAKTKEIAELKARLDRIEKALKAK